MFHQKRVRWAEVANPHPITLKEVRKIKVKLTNALTANIRKKGIGDKISERRQLPISERMGLIVGGGIKEILMGQHHCRAKSLFTKIGLSN